MFTYEARINPNALLPERLKDFDRVARDSERILSCDSNVWPRAHPGLFRDQASFSLCEIETRGDEWVIALELRSSLSDSEGGEFWPSDPSTPQPSWEFLGADIADYGLLSAINFFGLGSRPDLREKYSRQLSRNGLFQIDEVALEFLLEASRAHPEDAPFYVIGVWRVQ